MGEAARATRSHPALPRASEPLELEWGVTDVKTRRWDLPEEGRDQGSVKITP